MRFALVARSLLRVHVFSLTALPVRERMSSLRAQAKAWQPFMDPSTTVALRAGWGLALAFDRAELTDLLTDAGCDPGRVTLVPEPLMVPPLSDGVRMLQGLDGCEAQRWVAGWLRVSRWWPELPSLSQWQEFERLSNAIPDTTPTPVPPGAEALRWQSSPWAAMSSVDAALGALAPLEQVALVVGGGLLLAASAAVARQAWEADASMVAQARELRSLQLRAAPTLAARDKALQAAAETRMLAVALGAPMPIEVLQHVAQRLSPGVVLKELELVGRQLRLVVDLPPAVPRSTLVKDLQAGQWLQDVREGKGVGIAQGLSLDMRLSDLRPPLAAAAAPLPAAAAPFPVAASATRARLP